MAPIVHSCKLPGSRIGISVRWIVNDPCRWEQRGVGLLHRRASNATLVVEPDEHGVVRQVVFEPLTRERFLAMRREICGHDDLARVLLTDDMVRTYFWADWVPDYWVEHHP